MYKQLDIRTPEHLAHRLGVPPGLIEQILADKPRHYHPKPKATAPGKEPRPIVLISKMAKQVLKRINKLFQDDLGHPAYMHGGMKGRTIITNARPHIGADFLLKLDIKKFFPSISPSMVLAALMRHAGLSQSAAQVVTDLATHENMLITGSPASTIIASLVIREGTERIYGLITQHAGTMTVFVDDLSISGGKHLSKLESKCVEWLQETGVTVHPKKRVRTSGPLAPKIITGTDVSHGFDAPRGFRREIQALCKRYDEHYKLGGRLTDQECASLKGKLQHLRQLNLGMAMTYIRRYRHLTKAPLLSGAKPGNGCGEAMHATR